MPVWFLLALAAAFLSGAAETVRKRLVRDVDAWTATLLASGVATAALAPVVLARGPVSPGGSFWAALVVSGGINVGATFLVARSYQLSDLSLVTPLKGLTPIFTLGVAVLILGEVPTVAGAVGVGLVVAGVWVLSRSAAGKGGEAGTGSGPGGPGAAAPSGLLAPLRALVRDPGARLMLLVALLYGVSSTVDKVGVLASTPLWWALVLQAVVTAASGVVVLGSGRRRASLAEAGFGVWVPALGTGVATALMLTAQMTALTEGLAGYVIAVKRSSIFLTVLAGGVFFRERGTAVRLAAAAVILAGLVVVAVAG